MGTSSYAMHELARWRDANGPLGAEPNPARRDAFDAVLELLIAENERGTVLTYKNGATASVALWLENERPLYGTARTLAKLTFDELRRGELEADAAASVLGDRLRHLIEGRPAVLLVTEGPNPDDMGHVAALLNDALGSVDWLELGRQWLHEAAELATTEA